MKRRILLVDDEVAVLLTLKAVLEISGFDVDTAASAREGKAKLRKGEYHMIITDMRMERESSGEEVIAAARAAAYKPAIALLTAFPVSDESWQYGGADKLLVKPMQTRVLLDQIEKLFLSHDAKKTAAPAQPAAPDATPQRAIAGRKAAKKTAVSHKAPARATLKRAAGTKAVVAKKTAKKTLAAGKPVARKAAKKAAAKKK